MIGTSPLEYAWVVTWVVILHSIGPLCVGYSILSRLLPDRLRLWRYLEYWAYVETAFYLITYAYRNHHLQHPAAHPPPLGKEERSQLFRRCFESYQDLTTSFSRWFLDAPIAALKRENIKEWLRWAFLNTGLVDPTYEDELDTYVTEIERKLGLNFEPGRADIKSIRLTLDKVDALHRSLTWYLCIFVVDVVTHGYMYLYGFEFYRASIADSVGIIPPRPQALITRHRSPSPHLSYWYRRHTSKKDLPVVFIHGIGIGLYPYMQLFSEVNMGRREEEGQIGILAIEILPISSRITTPVPQKEEMCRRIACILRYHGFDHFVLLTHSYGSVVATHMIKTPELADRISSVILVDPVSILLHQPDVAYNFTVRAPKHANEWLVWYFGSKDMGVAHTLSRTFFWSQNILWKDDLFAHRATVFLSAKDSIINAPQVRRYLQAMEEEEEEEEKQEKGGVQEKGHASVPVPDNVTTQIEKSKTDQPTTTDLCNHGSLDVVWCPDLDHGQIFDLAHWRGRLKEEILKKARYSTV
ncbi:hypothetical protein A1O1_03083 [Capronia coronata CBS 617.96]|uniref:AB hydrolase-1 domain-containing protein n=1 Tax=Capronia coronata CBS 617.96 TaxID=1182541 RepID=W9YZF6_9EURO|nr:uncharacterized protein A1O1_03083 [Capronia coronata CBS 617.96]EXJ94686.1 hypothetical protein A1O1_03083 [Capronia coronata CBS 617.96]